MMNELEEDRLIQQAMQTVHADVEIPDPTKSWNNVQNKIQRLHQAKKRRKRLKIVVGVVALTCLIEISIQASILKSYANVSTLFREVKQNVIEIFFEPSPKQDTSAAKTSPPPSAEIDVPAVPEEVPLSDALEKLAFDLLLPSYLPQGFELGAVRIFREADGLYKNVYLEYETASGEIFKLSERIVEPKTASIKSDIASEAGAINNYIVNGNEAVLVVMPDNFVDMEWLTKSHIKISISGKLAEEEIVLFARSLK
ncbi:DUF4367 domain-containing protein [Cohnella faecalis]|uniref:DUF4367 domain-containing protein n=1 Tax=Cohnella faecalis TaxID=2315694 RepID=A0A398CEQ9_9BACL|nr:DUF4367 domain-containing protein [Cohnella faecalis]RIE01110.1 DUF4367 domain-containing protein [Cohnella faecalis]